MQYGRLAPIGYYLSPGQRESNGGREPRQRTNEDDQVPGRGPAGKIEILEPSRLPMASIYFYSPHSQLFNGVLIIKKYYRGAELGIALIWDLMTQSRSQVGQEMCVTDVLNKANLLLVHKSIK